MFESFFGCWFLGGGIGGGCPKPRHRHINRDIDKGGKNALTRGQSQISVPIATSAHGAKLSSARDWW